MAGVATNAQQTSPNTPAASTSLLPMGALLNTPVGGLERTQSTAEIVQVTGQPFARALRVKIGQAAPDTNATQLTVLNAAPVQKGDALLASFSIRGASAAGKAPAQLEFLFERASNPWTKSATLGVSTPPQGALWKRVQVPFTSLESYAAGEVMASLRLAFGPQTIEIGGLSIENFGKTKSLQNLVDAAAQNNPLGATRVALNLRATRQTMRGFGGNFAQPRYGSTEPMDAVGTYNLEHLRVAHARVGLPLNNWAPERGVYKDEAQAHAALLQLQMMARRKIPITASVWEGPAWMLPGKAEEGGRILPPTNYADCAEAIAQFLLLARDKYGAPVEFFSFNEPDYGVNFKFTSATTADFIRVAGPRFAALGLKTKFLVGDTANGSSFEDYARPLLEDPTLAPYLGPLAFHSWDVMGASELKYTAIAALGQKYNKPVWCTEAGHDAALWQAPDPWESWENALRTALAYERTLRLSGAELMDYWTYQDNYALVSRDGATPFPVWKVMRQLETALPPGSKISPATPGHADLRSLASVGTAPRQFSVLLVNPIGPGTVALEGLPARAQVTVTTSTSQLQNIAPKTAVADRAGRLSVSLPARSVVTVQSVAAK